jgi:hypothetical protein
MKGFKTVIALVAVAALFTVVLGATATLADDPNFSAHLSGRDEVPAVETKAQGQLVIHRMKDGAELHYKLTVSNLNDVTGAHLHHGAVGANGDVVVNLLPNPPAAGTVNGPLAEGPITAASLTGPLAGQTLQSLFDAIARGEIYVNVHTKAHPDGEIRGQVR